MSKKTAINPTRQEDYPEWYQQVIKAADLAEHSVVRGCMVIKPWGWGIWENIQKILDDKIKKTGHENVYFPLFIPLEFFQKEAEHVKGFAKECAVVTHHRLEKNKEGKLVPAAKLTDPLVVRPTSEMIIGQTVSKWVSSYRDLPIKINQWANIVRWEMRTRLFLRSTEFLWQEGHTFHKNKQEALEETIKMLNEYVDFCENYLAIPVIKGEKTEKEKFPGADATYTFEAMMQDGKALQGGTSHFLGQNFARSCEITFRDEKGDDQFVYSTSWGTTTRLIGAIIMVHSDDNGLVLPPKIAPKHVVILPVIHDEINQDDVFSYCESLKKEIENIPFMEGKLKAHIDKKEMRGGEKKWSWIKKGIPLLIEVGPRDIAQNSLTITKRKKDEIEKITQSKEEFIRSVVQQLEDMQKDLCNKAFSFQKKHTKDISSEKDFYVFFSSDNGGFAQCYWKDNPSLEEKIHNELNVTIRCILPAEKSSKEGRCIFSQEKTSQRVVFARAY